MFLLWLTRLLSFIGFALLTIGAIFPEWERTETGETIGLWQKCVITNDTESIEASNDVIGSGDSVDLSVDASPEPAPEPECVYKTNSCLNKESWLLVCSTVGCALSGAAALFLWLPKKCLYGISADIQLVGSLLYLGAIGIWSNQENLNGAVGWALAVGSTGVGVTFISGVLTRLASNKLSQSKYEPGEDPSNPYADAGESHGETNTDLTSM